MVRENQLCRVFPLLWVFVTLSGAGASELPTLAALLSHDAAPYREALDGLRNGLDGVARVESLLLADGEETADSALEALKRLQPRLIVALGGNATRVVLGSFKETPVVAGLILNAGDLANAHNATGVFMEFSMRLQWQWFRKILPRAHTLGVLFNPENSGTRFHELQRMAQESGYSVLAAEVPAPATLPAAFKRLPASLDALWGFEDPKVLSPQTSREILLYSYRNRVPLIGPSANWARAGALYALDRDYDDLGQQCALLVNAILAGAEPRALPPQEPRKVLYYLNLRAAEHMKLEISEDQVRGAREVYR